MERCISHPFDFKEDSDMKKEYDTSVKEAIERVMSVFSEYIKTTPYFDIVWSGKVGYIYISIDSCRGTVGDMDCLVIDSLKSFWISCCMKWQWISWRKVGTT